jgi:hypothetical protein
LGKYGQPQGPVLFDTGSRKRQGEGLQKSELLDTKIKMQSKLYEGIPSVKVNWTRSTESFFTREAFLKVIERCEELGWGVNGLEVFDRSGQFHGVSFNPCPESAGATWCRSILNQWQEPTFLFSATFLLPSAVD